tara:strand:+ start:704 stop:805 length:102 start_codon:yes stop_codon:yes gene_type:complete
MEVQEHLMQLQEQQQPTLVVEVVELKVLVQGHQ